MTGTRALIFLSVVGWAMSMSMSMSARATDAGTNTTTSATADTKPVPSPADAVREVLSSRSFEFCHDPQYPLTSSEKRWCDLGAGENKSACPRLREACKYDAQAEQVDVGEPWTIKLPSVGGPLRAILWIVIGLGLAMLIFLLVRHFLDHKPKDTVVKTGAPESGQAEAAAALARQVETDVQRLLERARAEAAVGDFHAAVGSVYAALLRRLEGAGILHVQPDQTNGDYLRKVKLDRPAIAPRMAEIVEVVERAQFADEPVTREGFDGAWTRVTGLLAERIGLPALLVVAILLSACGLPRADWEHSPSGRAGVIAFLQKRGFEVRERLLSVAKINEKLAGQSDEKTGENKASQVVLLPGARLGDEDWKALRTWVFEDENTLVVVGGKQALPDWIGMRIVEAPASKVEPIALSDAEAKRWGKPRARVPDGKRLDCKPGANTLLSRGHASYAAERWLGDDEDEAGRVLVVADDYLFRNASLLVDDNAALLDDLLRDGGTSIELVGDLTGLVSSNPVQSVQRGRLGPAMLQLAVFLLVLFVCKGARFGKPVSALRIQRREFAEHARALGLHYARAHGERHALGFLGTYAVERLRERVGSRGERSLSGLAEAVATRTGRPVGVVMRLLVEARDASKGVPAEKGARDLETAAELCKLLEQTGGSGGQQRIQSHV